MFRIGDRVAFLLSLAGAALLLVAILAFKGTPVVIPLVLLAVGLMLAGWLRQRQVARRTESEGMDR